MIALFCQVWSGVVSSLHECHCRFGSFFIIIVVVLWAFFLGGVGDVPTTLSHSTWYCLIIGIVRAAQAEICNKIICPSVCPTVRLWICLPSLVCPWVYNDWAHYSVFNQVLYKSKETMQNIFFLHKANNLHSHVCLSSVAGDEFIINVMIEYSHLDKYWHQSFWWSTKVDEVMTSQQKQSISNAKCILLHHIVSHLLHRFHGLWVNILCMCVVVFIRLQ